MFNDTPLVKRAYNLGLKAVPNFEVLDEEALKYYEGHLDQLPSAVERGFIIPRQAIATLEVAPVCYKVAGTNLFEAIAQTEKFAKEILGVEVNLRQRFVLPVTIPWQKVIPIFDPGLTNREMVDKGLKGQGIDTYEEVDVMGYYGAQSKGRPTLCLINDSDRPDQDTMGLSPDQLLATGKSYLGLRGYGLVQALRKFSERDFIDLETLTWFPEDRLPGGYVARGFWYPDRRQVEFYWSFPGYRHSHCGGRVVIHCPLVP